MSLTFNWSGFKDDLFEFVRELKIQASLHHTANALEWTLGFIGRIMAFTIVGFCCIMFSPVILPMWILSRIEFKEKKK